ncbi:MAG: helix-turn-helix domain-containing protein [Candidatus Azobacteroides sp.]|nr:helix-turn-helix domain-containing protein [Candidatus Azobacteroides sp.]
MIEKQKDNIIKLLKEKGKSKRELAAHLGIHENGINRLLDNPNIGVKRLEQIADFLNTDISVFLKTIYAFKNDDNAPNELSDDRVGDYEHPDDFMVKLLEIIKGQKEISEIERKNEELLSKIMDIIIESAKK